MELQLYPAGTKLEQKTFINCTSRDVEYILGLYDSCEKDIVTQIIPTLKQWSSEEHLHTSYKKLKCIPCGFVAFHPAKWEKI